MTSPRPARKRIVAGDGAGTVDAVVVHEPRDDRDAATKARPTTLGAAASGSARRNRFRDGDTGVAGKRAVLYLRVSGESQVKTDYDPEGLSIPAQRRSCENKAGQMGVQIIDEYVEPGRSATSMDKRVAFQEMLERIRVAGDVDYVLVYKLSRMNRNRIDDALVLVELRRHNVSLISATEPIDESPEGQLMHAMLAAMNEFRSKGDGADIRYKMSEKARKGGTLGLAPIGYLNARDLFEDREIRIVVPDPERAPFIPTAYELYATGDYNFDQLADELTDRGFRTRSGPRRPARPVSTSKLAALLRDRYYLGVVKHKDEEFPGRHEPLVTPELFERVQRVLEERGGKGVRKRVHHHYLKGSLWCGACHDRGRESRMILQNTVRRGTDYSYFFCRARQQHGCPVRYLDTNNVEDAVLAHYATIQFPAALDEQVRGVVRESLADLQQATQLRHDQLSRELGRLDSQEENLLDLIADGDVATPKIKERLTRIRDQRQTIERELATVSDGLAAGAALIEAGLDLLRDPQELYRRMSAAQRKLLNEVIFEKLYVIEDRITGERFKPPFDDLADLRRTHTTPTTNARHRPRTNPAGQNSSGRSLAGDLLGGVSNKTILVEAMGIEPTTSCMPCKRSTN